MTRLSTNYSWRPSRRIRLIAAVLVMALIGYVAFERLVLVPKRQHVIRRYEEFRSILATGDASRTIEFIAPEFRDWALDRMHVYATFAGPLDERSRVSVYSREAIICPQPTVHFYVISGGNVVKMVKWNGEWFMGRVYID